MYPKNRFPLLLIVASLAAWVWPHAGSADSFRESFTGQSSGLLVRSSSIAIKVDLNTVAGSPACHHVINEPGVYYLSGNLDVSKPTGVNIQAEGVTLDLNGFAIRRVSGSGGHGILVALPANRCTVENGSVRGFAFGVQAFSDDGVYRRLHVSEYGSVALEGGNNWTFDTCVIDGRGSIGVELSSGSGPRISGPGFRRQ